MKRIFAILGILLLATLFITPVALAQDDTFEIKNPLNASTVDEIINSVADFIFYIALAITPVMILVGAFFYLTSAGDPDQIKKAKNIITYTLIGLLIIYMSQFLMDMITNILGVEL